MLTDSFQPNVTEPEIFLLSKFKESVLLNVESEVSTVGVDLGCHVICQRWSSVLFEIHSQCTF